MDAFVSACQVMRGLLAYVLTNLSLPNFCAEYSFLFVSHAISISFISSPVYSDIVCTVQTWSANYMETWTAIRDDLVETDATISKAPVEFEELNNMYKCGGGVVTVVVVVAAAL